MKFETANKRLEIFSFSSLTDIVMLLLIFFLLTSQFVIQTGVKVKLPGAKNNEQTTPSRVIVSITKAGEFFLGSEKVPLQNLALKIEQLIANVKDKNLVIRADKSVEFDRVIKVMDAAKGVGVTKFIMETEKESF
ncbi:MAG: biopolymer transporter ExbD [Melioribacteraceae bacterium]|nr:biopolymer transporter ExbD [Melioribacteraceae bacterium]